MHRRAVAGGLAVALALAAGLLASPAVVLDRLAWLVADPLRLLAVLVALAVVRPFLAWPTTFLALLVGYGYGLAGTPLALALITVTSVPPYLLARRTRGAGGGSHSLVAGLGDGRAAAVAGRVVGAGERAVSVVGGARSVAASRLVPLPSDVVSVGAGLAGVRPLAYLLGTLVGEVPWAVAGTVAGASAERVATVGLSGVFDPRLVAAAALASLLLLAGPAYRTFIDGRRE